MKKIFYLNSLFFYYAIFFACALAIEVGLMIKYDYLSLLKEAYFVFLLQVLAMVSSASLGFAQKFIIESDRVIYIKMFKKRTFYFKENIFVFGTNNLELYHNILGGIRFRRITNFWINLKTDDRQLEIENTNYFNMYMSRKYFKKLHDALNNSLEKHQLQDNIKLRYFNK